MIAPALPRWVATALADEATGVNAMLLEVPRDVSEEPPRAVTVYNAFDDAIVARKAPRTELRADEWVLSVAPAEELEHAGNPLEEGDLRDSAPIVLHLSGVTVNGDDAASLAEANRVMRAVRRVLLQAFRLIQQAGTPLVLEGQTIELPEQWKSITKVVTVGSGQYDLVVVIPFLLTDDWAFSAPET